MPPEHAEALVKIVTLPQVTFKKNKLIIIKEIS